jgi:hypothetical protein
MVKSNNSKRAKGYLFACSLMVLFLGTLSMMTNVLAGTCPDSRDFNCSVIETCSGGSVNIFDECMNLCIFDDSATLSSGCFNFTLKFLDSKTLLGTDRNSPTGGCSVNFQGRSMTVEYMPLIGATGCKYNMHCTPCDGCCSP